MSSFLRSIKNAAVAASDALLGRGGGGGGGGGAGTGGAKPRPACQYGAKCYRKNPQHRIDESHPGDDDHDAPAASRPRPAAPVAPAADDHTAGRPPADAAAPVASEQEEEAAAPRPKKASSRRRGAAATATEAATEPASTSASASAAESSPAACASPPPTSALAVPVPQLSPTSTGSSPRVDKKMSVRDRRRRAQLEAAATSTPSPVASPPPPDENADAAAAAAPASLPSLPVPAAYTGAGTPSSSPAAPAAAAASSDDILLASLHALHHTPASLVPEFVEIRWESPAQAASNRGDFFIGRSAGGAAAANAKAADGSAVPRVHLVLASTTPRLAKMISRVHARISWLRTPILSAAQHHQQRDGTHGLIRKRNGAAGDSSAADLPPAYTYKFFIEDEGSVNGVFVNSIKQPSRGPPRLLSRGDKITFGGGAGRAAGEWLAQKPADAEFVFEFNCVERVPELLPHQAEAEAEAETASDDERAPQKRNGTSSLRKRALSVAAASASSASSTSPSTTLKRRKSEDDDPESTQEQPAAALLDRPASNVDMAAEDDAHADAPGEEHGDAVSEAASEDGSAGAGAGTGGDGDAGATQNFGDGDECGTGAHAMDATQDYVDHDRDAERAHAQEQATQDFGGAVVAADADDGVGATQDGGMYE